MIRFSYFNNSKVRALPKKDVISVARTNYINLPEEQIASELLVPDDLFKAYRFNKNINYAEFLEQYILRVLVNLDAQSIYDKYDGKILCCHEADRFECHRVAIMAWLNEHGLEVEEIV